MFQFDTLSEFLLWLAGPGLPYFVGLIVSLLASKFPQWNALAKEIKIIVPIVLAVLFAFIVRAINVPDVINNADLNFAFNVIMFYLSNQAQYQRQKLQG